MVIEFDKENKKIVLSALAAVKVKSVEEIEKYIETHRLEKVSVEDIQNAEGGKFDAADFKVFDDQIKKDEAADKSNKVVEESTPQDATVNEVAEEVIEEETVTETEEVVSEEEVKTDEASTEADDDKTEAEEEKK